MDKVHELQQWKWRHTICDAAIRILNAETEDPRKSSALKEYLRQLAEIDGNITKLEREERLRLGLPEPDPIVVGLQTAVLIPSVDKV